MELSSQELILYPAFELIQQLEMVWNNKKKEGGNKCKIIKQI